MKILKTKKQNTQVDKINPGYEEREKRTPLVGYILLIAMFFITISFGWQALDDLSGIPGKPEALSSCAFEFVSLSGSRARKSAYQQREIYPPPIAPDSIIEKETRPRCIFSSLEEARDIPQLFDKKIALESDATYTRDLLDNARLNLKKVNADVAQIEREYGIGLLEKILGGTTLFISQNIRSQLVALHEQQTGLEAELTRLTKILENNSNELVAAEASLRVLYDDLLEEYSHAWKIHDFWVFLIQFIAITPLFYFILRKYLALHQKDSPYTIIFTGLVAVASVLFLRVVFAWFWTLFIADLWQFVRNSPFLRSLVFYSGMILSASVFGGIVWLLQKRIWNPKRVAIRRLRSNNCPTCQFSLKLAQNYCANCGTEILESCQNCKKSRYHALSYCPHCGKTGKKTVSKK